jgi:riboflavin transporter FmnP
MKNRNSAKKLVLIAMLAAVAYVIVCLIRVPVVLFLNYEPKDVIITIGAFLLGPVCGFVVSLLVSLLEMVTISGTGPIGALMNLLSTCSFACTAAIIYKKRRTFSGAIIGLAVGAVAMTAVMVLWNWLITPLYMGVSREVVQGMLIPYFLPFNLFKATLNCALVLILYKPLVTALRRASLVEAAPDRTGGIKWGIGLLSAGLLALCILFLLLAQHKM